MSGLAQMNGNHSQEMVAMSSKYPIPWNPRLALEQLHKLTAFPVLNKSLPRGNDFHGRSPHSSLYPWILSVGSSQISRRPCKGWCHLYPLHNVMASDFIPVCIRNRPCGICYSSMNKCYRCFYHVVPLLTIMMMMMMMTMIIYRMIPPGEIYFMLSC